MRYTLLIGLSLITLVIHAQNLLPTPRNIQAVYDKGTRSTDGTPGKNYWQNTADYNLKISFDPGTRMISGIVDISYVNNSPDTLKLIRFKLYANLYKRTAMRGVIIDDADLTDGVIIDHVTINDQVSDVSNLMIMNTNMAVRVKPVAHGQSIRFNITYHYVLNKGSHIRTGEIEPGADFVAYFFPRIDVYDDIDGWNLYQYDGGTEFYNDFCHFKAAITVPNNQLVWATGNLLNAREVLSDKIYQRLQQAEKNDAVVTVVDSTETATATNHTGSTNTWVFEADNVTDFVFACSDHYMWRSSSLVVDKTTGRRTRVDAAYNPAHKVFSDVIHYARKTVEAMSYTFPAWPYPYPHESVFDGLADMEYPMMVNDHPETDHEQSIELTDHEIFHTMFPFYMGINETKYAWMDEGWATIGEWIISPMIDSTLVDEFGVSAYTATAGKEVDIPIMTLGRPLLNGYFLNAYSKPGMGYLYIKDLLGNQLFTKALHNYIEQWKGKHPMPNDFFYCMNKGAGRNLNWFWKKWFFEEGYPDLAIRSVTKSGNTCKVTVANIGSKPLPVDFTVYYNDNTIQKIHRNIGVWEKGNTSTAISFSALKPIRKLVLHDIHTPDSNPEDNVYEMK